MKQIKLFYYAIFIFSIATLSGCATSDQGTSSSAGAGTSATAEAPGGPGHGPEGAMNGNTP